MTRPQCQTRPSLVLLLSFPCQPLRLGDLVRFHHGGDTISVINSHLPLLFRGDVLQITFLLRFLGKSFGFLDPEDIPPEQRPPLSIRYSPHHPVHHRYLPCGCDLPSVENKHFSTNIAPIRRIFVTDISS